MNDQSTETLSVVVERELPHPAEKIWRALTQPQLLAEWLMKNDFEPVVDHRFKFSADWGEVACQVMSSRTKRCRTRGVRSVSEASSRGRSPRRARGHTCAWSKRASRRSRRRHNMAPRPDGRGSLRPWSA